MLQDTNVTICFTGLMIVSRDKQRNIYQIGMHSSTDDHELRLRLVKKGPDPETESEQTRTISHTQLRHSSDLWLDVEGEAPTRQTAEPFIAGGLDEPPSDPRDFRWLVDLEGEYFYNRPLKQRRGILKPILSVATGLFYTAELSSEPYLALPAAATGTKRSRATGRSLGRIAKVVGVNIHLTHPNQTLVLRAERHGSELWRLHREEGVAYEITVENGDTPRAPAGGDFHYYYDAFELNQGEPKILIEPHGLPVFGGIMSVCSPVGLGMSGGLIGDYD